MRADADRPFSVSLCQAMVVAAAWLVPANSRREWKQEKLDEIWHRWQFLFHCGEWNRAEEIRLVRNSLGAFTDAVRQLASNETLQRRSQAIARSPWTCLAALAAALLVFALLTDGLPATRQLVGPLVHPSSDQLVLMWLQPFGRKPHGVPPDVVPDWKKQSRSLQSISTFTVAESVVRMAGAAPQSSTVITTDSGLFGVLGVRPLLGSLAGKNFAALDYRTWKGKFRGDPHVIGREIVVAGRHRKIAAVLAQGFQFLSRRPYIYVKVPYYPIGERVTVLARVRPDLDLRKLNHELTRIAHDSDYYFFSLDPLLRITSIRSTLMMPIHIFGLGVAIAVFLALCVSRVRIRHIRFALAPSNRPASFRRAIFFTSKLALGLALVFVAGLEFTRPASSMLFTWSDGGSGLEIVWFYVVGSMAACFWAVADQRARCRSCLRLLAFPVRMGSPGSLLLDWSGTELLCSEGHGILQVPHLATSWDEEADRWIKLDDSWRGLTVEKTGG